jgi:hypothetical protein
MWIFYYDLADVTYQPPDDVTTFLVLYCIVAVCVLVPSFLEKKKDEDR